MRNRWILLLAAAFLFLGSFATPHADGTWSLAAEAQAAATVKVTVDVVHGTKTGQGADSASQRHKSVLEQMPQYTTFRHVGALRYDIAVGAAKRGAVAGRTVDVTVVGLTADKATVKVVVTDPAGGKHATTAKLKKGGVTAVAARSNGGAEVHLFIVTVNY